jgi:hypothetical protein
MRALPFLRDCRVRPLTTAHSVLQDAAVWTPAPVGAAPVGSVFHVAVDLSDAAEPADSYVALGQYLQVLVPAADGEFKPAFMAVASRPGVGLQFEFLVKYVPGTTAERFCGLCNEDVVELGAVMGKGFLIDRIMPPNVT